MLETLTPEAIVAFFTFCGFLISVAGNVFLKLKNKDLKGAAKVAADATEELAAKFKAFRDLMTPTIAQTQEQTDVAIEYPETHRMDDAEFKRMCDELTESGAQFNERILRDMVKQKEEQGVVEYVIMVEDHDRDPNTHCKHVFVSYGTPIVLPQDEALKRTVERHATICAVPN